MRPVLPSDVEAAARALRPLPEAVRAAWLRRILAQTQAADAYRKRFGRAHALWGDGSLSGRLGPSAGAPDLRDPLWCRCMAQVLDILADWRCEQAARSGVCPL